MIVIGNDLIDLLDRANQHTLRRKGIEKFFTLQEMQFAKLYADSNPLASLWSIKESAYKCLVKLGHEKSFSPAKIKTEIVMEDFVFRGIVRYENHIFYTKCIEDGRYIRSVATNHLKSLNTIKSIHLFINPNDNKSQIITQKLSKINDNQSVIFHKTENNIPIVTDEKMEYYMETSLSHEGQLHYVSILPEWKKLEPHLNIKLRKAYA
jgi:phosphopantetheinyl transferase (holo-ACP synthase)